MAKNLILINKLENLLIGAKMTLEYRIKYSNAEKILEQQKLVNEIEKLIEDIKNN